MADETLDESLRLAPITLVFNKGTIVIREGLTIL